jgi:hypothetical protein
MYASKQSIQAILQPLKTTFYSDHTDRTWSVRCEHGCIRANPALNPLQAHQLIDEASGLLTQAGFSVRRACSSSLLVD